MLFEDYLGNKTAWKILRLLSEAPGRNVTRSEIRKLTKSGNFALSRALEALVHFKILNYKKQGKRHYYSINLINEYSRLLMDILKKEKSDFKGLRASRITHLAETVRKIIETIEIKKIILFGSHAKGTASEESDFDLCIITEKNVERNKKITLSNKLKENIQLHYFKEKEFEELKKKKDLMTEEIIRDGIELV